jgi:hypothetical protein
MALDIKYNVYYSTSAKGPWTLHNSSPLTHNPAGNEYTVDGLKKDAIYYFLIVGGTEDNGEFTPLVSQAVGPDNDGAAGLGAAKPQIYGRPFSPRKPDDNFLGHRFEIT